MCRSPLGGHDVVETLWRSLMPINLDDLEEVVPVQHKIFGVKYSL